MEGATRLRSDIKDLRDELGEVKHQNENLRVLVNQRGHVQGLRQPPN
jgi:hypothetical protein